ncbi:MAG TPA: flagellar basal body rod C-terminal domain-containing protein [Bryobacteraceae bacterium]|nr:flagellar basal body rod C-terminal domain-containing protein [Bryobacteraceae bacterium]
MSNPATPLDGMQQAEARVDRSASRIAGGSLAAANAVSGDNTGDSVDLSTEMVNLMDAGNQFAANVKVEQTIDQMTRATIDLMA